MTGIDRRQALKLLGSLGAAPLVGGFDWSEREVEDAAVAVQKQLASRATSSAAPGFFTPHEWDTVRLLVDIIIPRDARSGSATEAGVPEFIDFMMGDGTEARRVAMREGLAWLDEETRRRFSTSFLESDDTQRRAVLDDIAWPARARPELQLGVGWFNSFRDLTGAGFFSSRMGHEDLQYLGNQVVATWNGCPDAQLRKLGVTYDVMNTRR
jgi:hypothetical protein